MKKNITPKEIPEWVRLGFLSEQSFKSHQDIQKHIDFAMKQVREEAAKAKLKGVIQCQVQVL